MVEQYEERIMNTGQGIKNTLAEVDDSILIVIDVQDCFLRKYDNARSQEIVARVVWLLHTAVSASISKLHPHTTLNRA